MTSYLVALTRNDLERAGSAVVTDQVRREAGKWFLAHRHIDIDPSLRLPEPAN